MRETERQSVSVRERERKRQRERVTQRERDIIEDSRPNLYHLLAL